MMNLSATSLPAEAKKTLKVSSVVQDSKMWLINSRLLFLESMTRVILDLISRANSVFLEKRL